MQRRGLKWVVSRLGIEREWMNDTRKRKLDMGIRYQDVIENAGGICRYLSRNLNVVWTQDLPCQG